MTLSGKLRELRIRVRGDARRPLGAPFRAALECARGLEVGGPSRVFEGSGLLPLYDALEQVDCVQWAAHTAWHTLDPSRGFVPQGARLGDVFIVDDSDLTGFADASYDMVFSSHVIEHLANPLGALVAWRRVSVPGGLLMVVAPHWQGTFDHRRALTTIEHMIGDYEATTGEDDLTHLEESLALHDRRRDLPSDPEQWEADRRANATTRALHHHTFDTLTLGSLVVRAGAEILAAQARLPHDIYLLARWGGRSADHGAAILVEAARHSPFRADRRAARRRSDRANVNAGMPSTRRDGGSG